MLSRVADSLYWMSRYLERAEHTARVLDVYLTSMLDQAAAEPRWNVLTDSLHAPESAAKEGDPYAITESLTFDLKHESSIASLIGAARENARQVREQISSEMWEEINRLHLHVRSARIEEIWAAQPHEFLMDVKQGAHLFQGVTDGTMNHGEGWRFIQLGRYLERAGATARLLSAHSESWEEGAEAPAGLYSERVCLLKCCTALEAYCKVHSADLQWDGIVEFLLVNAEFPHSVRFATERVQGALRAIAEATGSRASSRADRLAGRLVASLGFAQADEILADGLLLFTAGVQSQCAEVHSALGQTYTSYPVESKLLS